MATIFEQYLSETDQLEKLNSTVTLAEKNLAEEEKHIEPETDVRRITRVNEMQSTLDAANNNVNACQARLQKLSDEIFAYLEKYTGIMSVTIPSEQHGVSDRLLRFDRDSKTIKIYSK